MGPLYIHHAKFNLDGKTIGSIGDAIGKSGPTWRIDAESCVGLRKGKGYNSTSTTIFTARPIVEDATGSEWVEPLVDTLKQGNLSLNIKYAYFDTWPLNSEYLQRSKMIHIF